MKTLKVLMLALLCAICLPSKADEGMWLLQMMQEKHLIDRLKAMGLSMEAEDVYSPNKISLKDAVGIFGGGCTGEIISPDGLILTNHHCGYGAIQQHSSVEHDYLKYGFWAKNRSEELATPGLAFTFVERIDDVTDKVFAKIKSGEIKEEESFGQPFLRQLAKAELEASDLKGKPGIRTQALPFFAGNKYYCIYLKTYKDVRMVAAPPSSIGKFGGETDNWMWPRHTCDFSVFRIYADANGEPADYSPNNVPLKAKKHLAISLKGIEEGDYAMIMGFPGSTNRYLTQSEIKQRMFSTNEPRIRIRGARQDVLREEMYANDKILLGITGTDIPLVESEDGNVVVFVVSNRLFSYNSSTNKLSLIFSFYDKENADDRTLYDQHGIKILNVDEGGNVQFVVYGYMNRGMHEGEVGIQLYSFRKSSFYRARYY